jgi:hypothetical protein
LQTQEKENANLRLRQGRNWLVYALAGVGLLFLSSYFAYANQRTKNRIQMKQREVEAMKLEKVLKDQELYGIDAMSRVRKRTTAHCQRPARQSW